MVKKDKDLLRSVIKNNHKIQWILKSEDFGPLWEGLTKRTNLLTDSDTTWDPIWYYRFMDLFGEVGIDCKVTSFDPKAVKNMYLAGGKSKTLLTEITIPRDIQSLPELAFYNFRNLLTIKIPKSMQKIGDNAFLIDGSMPERTFYIPKHLNNEKLWINWGIRPDEDKVIPY